MSKVAITGNASGTGVFTVASPNSNVDRVLTLPDESGTVATVENLPAAAYGRVVRTAGNITTTSTSLVDVTGATVTLTTGAFPVAYGAAQNSFNDIFNAATRFNVNIDGVLQFGTTGQSSNQLVAGLPTNTSFSGQSAVLTAGAHTIKEQWAVSSNTSTLRATSDIAHMFYAQEIR